jgi:hypothetical protein
VRQGKTAAGALCLEGEKRGLGNERGACRHVSKGEYASQSPAEKSRWGSECGFLKVRSETLRAAAIRTKEARRSRQPTKGGRNGCAAFATPRRLRINYCPKGWPVMGAPCAGMAPAVSGGAVPLQPHGAADDVVPQPGVRWNSPPWHPAPSTAAEINKAAVQCLVYTIALSIL